MSIKLFLTIIALIIIILVIVLVVCDCQESEKTLNSISARNQLQVEMDFISQINEIDVNENKHKLDIPIYYINLKRSPDRNEYMQRQIKCHNVFPWTRIEAVDGENDLSVNYINLFKGTDTLNNGEIGCTLSHLRAIETAYHDGVEYALILEDDASFDLVSHWDKPLSQYIAEMTEPWATLQLYSNFDYSSIQDTYHCPPRNTWLTLAYVINRQAIKDILAKVKPDQTFILCPSISSPGVADSYIYNILGCHTRYLINPPLFVANNIALTSTIHDDHTEHHLHLSLKAVDIYINKIIRNPCYHRLEVFNLLAQPKLIYNQNESTTQVDIVLAYYKYDLYWFFDMLSLLKRSQYRLFVYSKGGQPIPDEYRHLVHQWIELRNVGRCDHTYIYHLLNFTSRSQKTFLVKDAGIRHMSASWLKENLSKKHTIGPNMSPVSKNTIDFQLSNYEQAHDQNKGDPYIRPPKELIGLYNWCRFVFELDINIDLIIYCGVILSSCSHVNSKRCREYLLRAGLSMSYASNVETGHYMERVWAYLLQ